MSSQPQQSPSVGDLLDSIGSYNIQGYARAPLLNPLDQLIFALSDLVSENPDARSNARTLIGDKHKFIFLGFAERMASYAVRTKSKEVILKGLRAYVLQEKLGDFREGIPILALLYQASLKTGYPPDALFLEAAKLGDSNTVQLMSLFLKRDEGDKSLSSMGYIESSDKEGFRYQRKW